VSANSDPTKARKRQIADKRALGPPILARSASTDHAARLELADAGIVVSTFYPFVTSTEFIDSIKDAVG
jgi:hypothetical protein